MCGIVGLLSAKYQFDHDMGEIVTGMANQLLHRGPDDHGIWLDYDKGVCLAHRRLSIQDLSSAGHQPMVSSCGRYVLVFNGEIYNYKNIRSELDKSGHYPRWKGHSDTEILLEAISFWGLTEALRLTVGMFAIGLWDRQENELFLARDRIGEKPLYYGYIGNDFVFSSELKALCVYPGFDGEINQEALALYLQHNYVPTPYSIYKGIFKLPPGSILKITSKDLIQYILPIPIAYWSLKEVATNGQVNLFTGTEYEAQQELEHLLSNSIAGQVIADVPLGSFLSGGIDSSIVAALMQSHSNKPVKTFSIGFHDPKYNEANYASEVATYLGTEHTELYVSPEEAMDVIPSLPSLYDEPFADASQIPTYLLCKLAKQHVTVSLSGDGGDELFGGYNRHILGPLIWRRIHWLPRNLRLALAGILTSIPAFMWDKVFQALNMFLSKKHQLDTPQDKLHKIADLLANKSPEEIYISLVSFWKEPLSVVKTDIENFSEKTNNYSQVDVPDLEHKMMYLDSISYLPDDILVKVDRAAMGVSLETRVPFLDHRLVEFAWKIPVSMKIRQRKGKWLLRQLLEQYVPGSMIDRPKSGFGLPLNDWLRGPLSEWANELLDFPLMHNEGFFHYEPIKQAWVQHLQGKRNNASQLWNILMFQAWYLSNK